MQREIYDVCIIGSGGAGCAAAIEAKKNGSSVLIITAGKVLDSKTFMAQGGIQAPMKKNDSPQKHFADTLKAGEYKNNKFLVKVLSESAVSTIKWLEFIGIIFDREPDGKYKLQNAAGLSVPRILSCGDKSGNRIMDPLINKIVDLDIQIIVNTIASKIYKDNFFNINVTNIESKKDFIICCKSVVVATGGAVPEERRYGFLKSTNKAFADTIALAHNSGLEVVEPNLVQYHPTGVIYPESLRRNVMPEVLRSSGATLLNKDMEVFADSMLTRKLLCNAIIKECKEGRCEKTKDGKQGVWLNTPSIDKIHGKGYCKKNFHEVYKKFNNVGHDISIKPVLVYPVVHYSLGGIEINRKTETNVEGIYAAGEATYGVHGEDRLMGNSLLDIFVFGRIAGAESSLFVKKMGETKTNG